MGTVTWSRPGSLAIRNCFCDISASCEAVTGRSDPNGPEYTHSFELLMTCDHFMTLPAAPPRHDWPPRPPPSAQERLSPGHTSPTQHRWDNHSIYHFPDCLWQRWFRAANKSHSTRALVSRLIELNDTRHVCWISLGKKENKFLYFYQSVAYHLGFQYKITMSFPECCADTDKLACSKKAHQF